MTLVDLLKGFSASNIEVAKGVTQKAEGYFTFLTFQQEALPKMQRHLKIYKDISSGKKGSITKRPLLSSDITCAKSQNLRSNRASLKYG